MKRYVIGLVIAAATLAAQDNAAGSDQSAQGWITAFDGQSLMGWTSQGTVEWKASDGAIVAEAGEYGWLRYDKPFSDFELKLEFRTAADGNSGVFLRCSADGAPHLTGYEVQIFDKHERFPTGSVVGHVAARPAGAIKPGEWQLLEISAIGPHIVVKLDGSTLLQMRDGKSKSGYIGFQYNKGKKIEFRNVKIRPV